MKSKLSILLLGIAGWFASQPANACTGITLKSKDGTTIVARTIEWGGSNLNSQYVIVPRGYTAQSYTPEGINGMKFTARYGYVGLAVEQKEFIAEGVNEAGLSAGLFYFPSYGKYEDYNASEKENTISDLQLVSWILGNCATLDEVKEAVKIPVIGNGDVTSPEAARQLVEMTGCDGIMIGRGAQGNPWIFRQILHWMETGEEEPKPDLEEVKAMILRHAKMLVEYKGAYTGIREMRKHVAWYTFGFPGAAKLREKVNHTETYEDLEELLQTYLKANPERD